jgi:ligand-binding SRPBCC domain-containing protein
MHAGARVVIRVKQFGFWLTWVSVIEAWEPESRFVDVQEKGPFASWRHEHLIREGRLVDRVSYEIPLAVLGGALVDAALVRPELERMFAHRHRVTREALLR